MSADREQRESAAPGTQFRRKEGEYMSLIVWLLLIWIVFVALVGVP